MTKPNEYWPLWLHLRECHDLCLCETEILDIVRLAVECHEEASKETVVEPPRFPETWCSQCGRDFGPGDHGFSHCEDHA